jgi:hypothetical protein
MAKTFTPCKFTDASGNEWQGETDGTTWNGFDNVWVNAETFKAMLAKWREEAKASGDDEEWVGEVEETVIANEYGMYSFAYGYAFEVIKVETVSVHPIQGAQHGA